MKRAIVEGNGITDPSSKRKRERADGFIPFPRALARRET